MDCALTERRRLVFGADHLGTEMDRDMRLYFHLQDGTETIRDEDGVEVPDVAVARAEALRTIHEMRREHAARLHDWTGWKLAVADDSGAVLFSLDVNAQA